jgi:hypothetical protein
VARQHDLAWPGAPARGVLKRSLAHAGSVIGRWAGSERGRTRRQLATGRVKKKVLPSPSYWQAVPRAAPQQRRLPRHHQSLRHCEESGVGHESRVHSRHPLLLRLLPARCLRCHARPLLTCLGEPTRRCPSSRPPAPRRSLPVPPWRRYDGSVFPHVLACRPRADPAAGRHGGGQGPESALALRRKNLNIVKRVGPTSSLSGGWKGGRVE